jgi:hypothetical protein
VAEKDAKTKEYMSDNERFADVFNYYIYGGKQVIKAENLHELDTTMISLPYGEEGVSDSIQKYRDVLKYLSAMYDERAAYLLLGIENQSNVHYAMPVRNMLYDAGQYAKQVETAAAAHRIHRQQGGGKTVSQDEFLSGFYKEDRLLPVITLVVYWSPNEWDAPLSIHEMLDIKDEALLALVPDYKINLIAPGQMDDADFGKFKTTLAEAFQYIKYSKSKPALQKMLQDNEKFHALDRRTAELINVVTGSELEIRKDKEVVDMCLAIEEMKKEAIEIGKKEAFEAAKKEAEARESANLVSNIKSIMEKLQYNAEQAMDLLGIPEEKRKKYVELLNS